MNNDLISRSALLDSFSRNRLGAMGKRRQGIEEVVEAIEAAPAVDAAPVRHGEWVLMPVRIRYGYPCASWKCSYCGHETFLDPHDRIMNYCNRCGAKMDRRASDAAQHE